MGPNVYTPKRFVTNPLESNWTVALLTLLGGMACTDDLPNPSMSMEGASTPRSDAGKLPGPSKQHSLDAGEALAYRFRVQPFGDEAGHRPCDSVQDCPEDDGAFCNGVPACEVLDAAEGGASSDGKKVCVNVQPCPETIVDDDGKTVSFVCDEQLDTCDCDPRGVGKTAWYCAHGQEMSSETHALDVDNDGENADTDCDDSDGRRNHGETELCDAEGLDEDCDMRSVVQRDQDHDEHYDRSCLNFDPATGNPVSVDDVDDCDDTRASFSPDEPEVCDGVDNNCNGLIDEKDGAQYGLRQDLCLDVDRDGYVGDEALRMQACPQDSPRGYLPCPAPGEKVDCDDDPNSCGDRCHPGAAERCDGFDNDCDGLVDRDEDPAGQPVLIAGQPDLQDTEFACGCPEEDPHCDHPGWYPVTCPEGRDWCYPDYGGDGCTTDITTLDQCGKCEPTDCKFACDWSGESAGCEEISQIDMGRESACAVTTRGRLACWGRGAEGQLGNRRRVGSTAPVPVAVLSDAHHVSVGFEHACAIAGPERVAYCWGSDTRSRYTTDNDTPVHGLLGHVEAFEQESDTPVEVNAFRANPRLTRVDQIEVGYFHTCALLHDRTVLCWGDPSLGRLGNGGNPAPYPNFVVDEAGTRIEALSIALGKAHSCAVAVDRRVLCWGSNKLGQLGHARNSDLSVRKASDNEPLEAPDADASVPDVTEETGGNDGLPIQPYRVHAAEVPGLRDVEQLASGGFHTCALDGHGDVFCWGGNQLGELGLSGEAPFPDHLSTPARVAGLPTATQIATGWRTSCAVSEGFVWCWGARGSGLMGTPAEGVQRTPKRVDLPGSGVASISVLESLCVVTNDSRAYCLGANDFGQLGSGTLATNEPIVEPEPVSALTSE